MSLLSRAADLRVLIASAFIFAACGEDKVGGTIDLGGDADSLLEILIPDGIPDGTPDSGPNETLDDDSGDADVGPCPGCTGSPCADSSECNSGYCLEGPDGNECVRTCSDQCPTGYACTGVTAAGGDVTFLCIYAHLVYCQPCNIDGDCETGIGGLSGAKCLPGVVSPSAALPGDAALPEDGRFCRTPCTADSCPTGATCEEVSIGDETPSLCRPGSPNEPGVCTCSSRAVALTLATDCSSTNEHGTCDGARICAVVGPVAACDATPAAAELCNDEDDDCDGETDEDFPLRGEPCDGNDSDECTTGVYLCGDDGALACTDDQTSEVERCDGADNDCDGETDEDFGDVGAACDGPDPDNCKDGALACDGLGVACNDGPETATSGEELCNGADDNCNTTVDEGFEDKNQPCDGDDADGCKDGTFICAIDGLGLACNDDGATRVEVCNELDDDCQNGPDDTFVGKLLPCDGPDADECPDGINVCSPDGTSLACTDDGISKIEVCNDIDDDCDGGTDEDFALKGQDCDSEVDTDLCTTGKWVCGGNTLVCDDDATSLVETCNGEDDDCDGLTDGLDGDLADELNPNQLGACAGSVKACAGAGGYVEDYSSVPGHGQPETPNATYADENCDGIDGDEARGAFVVVGAPNGGTCTKAAPCGSVTYAITQTAANRPHVYVQAGTYTEVVEIPSGVNVEIYGGYNANWVRKARTETGHKVTLKGIKHQGDGEYIAVRVRSATVKLADLVVQAPSPGSDERKNGQGLSSYGVHAVQSSVTLERVEVLQGNGATGADGGNGSDALSLTAPQKAAKGGSASQAVDICNDSTNGNGVGGRTNDQCSSGTGGGTGGDGGTMDGSCSCFGTCGICGGSCGATNGAGGTGGTGPGAGGGGTAGNGGSSCNSVGPGGPGSTPSHGTGGDAGARGGSVVADYWYGGNGTQGTLGGNGSGGGGGGGSGGCDNDGGVPLQNSSGAGGGGGGAGGCRAQVGGGGGKSGGSSFGAYAIGGSVTVIESRFVLGNGGGGGRGGAGGTGQPGGDGGDGGDGAGTSQAGGSGGDGGDGGASGGGGGGAGGNSFGIYTQGSSVDAGGTNDFSGGGAGPRGEAGDAPAAAGTNGDGDPGMVGRVEAVATCTSPGSCGD